MSQLGFARFEVVDQVRDSLGLPPSPDERDAG
jgi:hypothetical protein